MKVKGAKRSTGFLIAANSVSYVRCRI